MKHVIPLKGISLSTANDVVEVNEGVEMKIDILKEKIIPLLLDATPPVLTVGERCMQQGYTFVWPAYEKPFLITPKAIELTCRWIPSCL